MKDVTINRSINLAFQRNNSADMVKPVKHLLQRAIGFIFFFSINNRNNLQTRFIGRTPIALFTAFDHCDESTTRVTSGGN
jgi:hypothetical protein